MGRLFTCSGRNGIRDDPAANQVSSTATGAAWKSPSFVDNYAGLGGFQVIPSATAAEGIVQIAWYDTRDDLTPF